jgi:hypothetical protein
MKEEVKNYLISVRDRSLGITLGRERQKEWDGRAGGIFLETMFPLFIETSRSWDNFRDRHCSSSVVRAVALTGLELSSYFGAMGVDMVANGTAVVAGSQNIAAGILLKGAINAGSHMMVDAIKYTVNHPPKFSGISITTIN